MKNILIVGGGFAGVWAALAAAELRTTSGDPTQLRIQLINPRDELVIRPRLYEADPASMTVPLAEVLAPVGVELLRGSVVGVDTGRREVRLQPTHGNTPGNTPDNTRGAERTLGYDRLILATGSQLTRPRLPGAELIHDVDTVEAAGRLEEHLRGLGDRPAAAGRFTVVVVGAGFTGVEVATELPDRLRAVAGPHAGQLRVVLVERAGSVLPGLGDDVAGITRSALAELAIDVRLDTSVAGYDGTAVTLSTGEALPAATVVWTAGLAASPLAGHLDAQRDHLGRLAVDTHLHVTGVSGVFAAGDVAAAPAEDGHTVVQSCQHAMPQGTTAGYNAAAELLGVPLRDFAPDPYATCLDLGAAGAVYTKGWDRQVELTGAEAKALKKEITGVWIYPPVPQPADAGPGGPGAA